MKLKKTLSAAFLLVIFLVNAREVLAHGDIKTLIESRMGWGHPDRLAYLFDEAGVTLELFKDPVKYTTDKAKEEITAFFDQYPPKRCEITSQGTYGNGTRYFKGTYTTSDDHVYSAYFEAALDQDEGHYHLSLIRIEQ